MSLREAVTAHPLFTKTRLCSLYSDFRKLKEANPDGLEANLIAWKSLLEEFFNKSLLQHTFVLDTEGLLEELTLPNHGKPMALDFVLEELVKSGYLIPFQQFQKETVYSSKWVRPILQWAINKFIMDTSYKLSDRKTGLKVDKLVSLKILEQYTRQLTQKFLPEKENMGAAKSIFSHSQFKKLIRDLNVTVNGHITHLSDLDYEVLLMYLHRVTQQIQLEDGLIKLGNESITQEDRGIFQLKSTIDASHEKSADLGDKIDNLDSRIKRALKAKNRELAKILLRSKRLAQESLSKQLEVVHKLESVLYKIDEASTNIQLVSALETGTSLLKSLNVQIGGVERVEDIMSKLEDETVKVDEISKQISSLGSTVIDDAEIDEEYEAMLIDDKIREDSAKIPDQNVSELTDKLAELAVAPSEIKRPEKAEPLLHN